MLACSALKESYRQRLMAAGHVRWVFLDGSEELVRQRLTTRQGHYMGSALLHSQFATLERPAYGLRLPIDDTPPNLVRQVLASLREDPRSAAAE